MRFPLHLGLFLTLFLAGCASSANGAPASARVTVIDGDRLTQITSSDLVPAILFGKAGILPGPADRALVNGRETALAEAIEPRGNFTLELRHAVTITIKTTQGDRSLETSALTVGQVLAEAGIPLQAADRVDPPAATYVTGPLTVTYIPSRELAIRADGRETRVRTSAATVGQALAEAGIALVGLDQSLPGESEPLPADGRVRVVRVVESVVLTQKSIPFKSEFTASDQVELDQQSVVQPGEPGISMSRTRVRSEDGQEVSRNVEGESVVRPAKNRIIGYGTKVVVRSLEVPGGTIQYWRTVSMYATSYSPCRSAADRCYYGTSSGLPVQRGVVAMVRRLFLALRGQQLYIPGYGTAVVGDVGGGFPDGRPWIDLAYSDDDWVAWHGYVTVYFLTPVPANILYVFQ
jgi:uncharacterized protein YabE (DUF348 family)